MHATKSYFSRPLALLMCAAALAASLMAVVLASPAQAATLTVNSTADTNDGACTTASGGCTLREAIDLANTSSGVADTINFALGSEATITLTSELPTITDSAGLTIDGASTNITISGNKLVRVFAVGTGAKLTLSNLTVADGFASELGGGGIFNRSGTLEVNNSTLSGNSATLGGGILSGGGSTVTVNNSTLSGNSSSSFGGGITAAEGSTLTVTNSTFSANTASASGGGIWNQVGTATITNSTFSGNTAGVGGGGITSVASTITIRNTILASSTCSTSDSGTFTDEGGNLDEGATCPFSASSSKSNTPAGLDPAGLQNNGGATNTIALQASSAAIDAAVSCPPPTTDQRGVQRPQGEACDSGAFELVVELGEEGPQTKAECKNGGYKEFGFKNQGQCIKAVKHGR
jgi:CSLREA domain-containing protein